MNVKQMNTTALAYIGDAVYETYIRQHVMSDNAVNVDVLHRRAVAFVSAGGQAYVIKKFMRQRDEAETEVNDAFRLTDEETSVVRRARNHKISSKAKNADPVTYKWATAFEALVGYLYLSGFIERLEMFVRASIDVIENERR